MHDTSHHSVISTIIKTTCKKHSITIQRRASDDPASFPFANMDNIFHYDFVMTLYESKVSIVSRRKFGRSTMIFPLFVDNKRIGADQEYFAETEVYGIWLYVALLYVGQS
jgi:hypothetical protein